MALIAEEIVEEWLNRNGYFTIRGAKNGLYEADVLAIKETKNGLKKLHFEVTVSYNPIGYVGGSNNAKRRSSEEIRAGVNEWVIKKFLHPKKVEIRDRLSQGGWQFCVVFGKLRHPEELQAFEKHSEISRICRFSDVLSEVSSKSSLGFPSSGKDLVDLIGLSFDAQT